MVIHQVKLTSGVQQSGALPQNLYVREKTTSRGREYKLATTEWPGLSQIYHFVKSFFNSATYHHGEDAETFINKNVSVKSTTPSAVKAQQTLAPIQQLSRELASLKERFGGTSWTSGSFTISTENGNFKIKKIWEDGWSAGTEVELTLTHDGELFIESENENELESAANLLTEVKKELEAFEKKANPEDFSKDVKELQKALGATDHQKPQKYITQSNLHVAISNRGNFIIQDSEAWNSYGKSGTRISLSPEGQVWVNNKRVNKESLSPAHLKLIEQAQAAVTKHQAQTKIPKKDSISVSPASVETKQISPSTSKKPSDQVSALKSEVVKFQKAFKGEESKTDDICFKKTGDGGFVIYTKSSQGSLYCTKDGTIKVYDYDKGQYILLDEQSISPNHLKIVQNAYKTLQQKQHIIEEKKHLFRDIKKIQQAAGNQKIDAKDLHIVTTQNGIFVIQDDLGRKGDKQKGITISLGINKKTGKPQMFINGKSIREQDLEDAHRALIKRAKQRLGIA